MSRPAPTACTVATCGLGVALLDESSEHAPEPIRAADGCAYRCAIRAAALRVLALQRVAVPDLPDPMAA